MQGNLTWALPLHHRVSSDSACLATKNSQGSKRTTKPTTTTTMGGIDTRVPINQCLPHLRYDPSKEPVPRTDGYPDAGQAEAQALNASNSARDGRQDDVEHDVALETLLISIHDPAFGWFGKDVLKMYLQHHSHSSRPQWMLAM